MSMLVKDKSFNVYISEKEILERVKKIAIEINESYRTQKPLFVAILNGSFMFASDLMKQVDIPSEISFVKVASYEEMQSTGVITQLIGLKENPENRHIVIVEDIIDSGKTMDWIVKHFKNLKVSSIEIVTLLHKYEATEVSLSIKYTGFKIPNKFVVGYGLDYDGYGRNLRDIYQIEE